MYKIVTKLVRSSCHLTLEVAKVDQNFSSFLLLLFYKKQIAGYPRFYWTYE